MKIQIELSAGDERARRLIEFLKVNHIKFSAERELLQTQVTGSEVDRSEKAEEYLQFQEFNMGSRLPGWMGRLDETWGGNKAEF